MRLVTSVCPFVCLFVRLCALSWLNLQRAIRVITSLKVYVCVSVISGHMRIIARMRSIGVLIIQMWLPVHAVASWKVYLYTSWMWVSSIEPDTSIHFWKGIDLSFSVMLKRSWCYIWRQANWCMYGQSWSVNIVQYTVKPDFLMEDWYSVATSIWILYILSRASEVGFPTNHLISRVQNGWEILIRAQYCTVYCKARFV